MKIAYEYVRTSDGQLRWGPQGAAGMLFHHPPTNTYLLTHRSPEVQMGDTWGIPGGAIDKGEEPYQAALRETQEELGQVPQHTVTGIHEAAPVPDWKYHTVMADVPEQFDPDYSGQWETQDHGWFTPEEIEGLNLHPGFASAWNFGHLRPRTSMADGIFYHTAPAKYRQQIEQHGLLPSHDAPESPWSKARENWHIKVEQPPGVYMHDDPTNARGYAYSLQGLQGHYYPGDENDFFEDDWDYSGQPDYDTDPEGHENFEPTHNPQPAYDIWKVNTKGLPMHIDPEPTLLRGPSTAEEAQKRINEERREYEEIEMTEGHRWYTPGPVPPQNISLHDSVYPGEMTQEDGENTIDQGKKIPYAWQEVPLDQWNPAARKRYLGRWRETGS